MPAFLRRIARRALGALGVELKGLRDRGAGSMTGLIATWRAQASDAVMRGAITQIEHARGTARFFVNHEVDHIQRELIDGRFYEVEELDLIARHFRGGTFVDVGANIGNHSVFVGRLLSADRIIAFEPNPEAAQLLETNLSLNALEPVSQVRRVGLSDQAGAASIAVPSHNLGGARLTRAEAGEGGTLPLAVGDEELANEAPSLIKIDTEGFEVSVLRGLAKTLESHAPDIFVEVEPDNRTEIDAYLAGFGYQRLEEFSRYPPLTNILYRAMRPDKQTTEKTPHSDKTDRQ